MRRLLLVHQPNARPRRVVCLLCERGALLPELDVPAQQAGPTQSNGHRLGAEKVLVTEPRIFADDHGVRFQRGPIP